MNNSSSRIVLAVAVSVATVGSQFSSAQDIEAASANSKLEEVIVLGFGAAVADALAIKRQADQVMDAITADDVAQFPDQNIAEAIQRIAGVSITRTNGEGESVTIRGLDPTFTRIEIDGRTTMVTADSANPERASVLNVFASELYNRIEVIKSPTAADVEGGIGGVVRLHSPSPIETGELKFGLEGTLTDADVRDDQENMLLGYYSNIFADGKGGVLLTASLEDLDRRVDKLQANQGYEIVEEGFLADGSDPNLLALVGGAFPGRSRVEQRSGERERVNISLKLEYEPTDKVMLFANLLAAQDDRDEDRARAQLQWSRGQLESGTLDSTNTLREASFTKQRVEYRSFTRSAEIVSKGSTAGFEWFITPDIEIRAEIASSSSEEDFTEYRVDHRTNKDGLGGYVASDDPRYPAIFTESASQDLTATGIRGLQLQQRVISLDDQHVRADLIRTLNSNFFSSIEAGFRVASSEFKRRQGAIAGESRGLDYGIGSPNFGLDGNFGNGFATGLLSIFPSIDPSLAYNQYPSQDEFSFNDENLWTISEDTRAVYGMARFNTETAIAIWRGNVGVRIVDTGYEGQGRIDIDTDNEEILLDDSPALERDYQEVLPALNIVGTPRTNESLQFRFAASKAMTRPTINEINPGSDVNVPDAEIDRGNPDLDPFLAWQYDLGVEYYFGEDDDALISATLFTKDVENFILPTRFAETITFAEASIPQTEYQVSTFTNGGDASISGIELNLQTPFSKLPGIWANSGVFANFTYTDSEFQDANGNQFTFPGASETTYNLVLFFDHQGFSTRLAYNYRDDFLVSPSDAADGSNTLYAESQGRVDFAARYRFENGFRLSFDALNLTEEQSYQYWDTPNRLEDLEFEGRILSLSFGYTF